MGRKQTLVLELRRDDPNEQWGFSLIGGADLDTPLIVTRVGFGSPADGVLRRGDVINKIGNYDARDIRHQDAQSIFSNAGSNVKVVVFRDPSNKHNTSTASSMCSSHPYTPLSVSPNLSPRSSGKAATPSPRDSAGAALYRGAPFNNVVEGYFKFIPDIHGKKETDQEELEHVQNQPYRTTPLVLPGAKVKRDTGPTESYLRHHPNPNMRSPNFLDPEQYMRQKVADSVIQRIATDDPSKQVVHKQFNSPIGLYSDANIVDTLKKQTGVAPPPRKPIVFDPSKSETLKALQEHEITMIMPEPHTPVQAPVQPKVFHPHKAVPNKKPAVHQQPYVNSLGEPLDVIHQSGSFKRLMNHVLAEAN